MNLEEFLNAPVGTKFLITKGFQGWRRTENGEHLMGTGESSTTMNTSGTIIEYLGIKVRERFSSVKLYKNLKSGQIFTLYGGEHKKMEFYTDGMEIPDFKSKPAYKIKYNGKFLKPKKFKDMGQVKVSLLISFGYFGKIYSKGNHKRCPELRLTEIPYWFEGGEDISLEEFKNVEIVEVRGKQIAPVEDFNAYEYIKDSNKKLKAICEYGAVVKDMFTKIQDDSEFSYFLTFTPDIYDGFKDDNYNYELGEKVRELGEDSIIKEILKSTKLKTKDYKKCSKYGKTAIAVKNEEHLFALIDLLPSKNVEFFSTSLDGVREYNKEVKRKQTIRNIMLED